MKKNLRYFMTLLLMMVASVGWADNITIDFESETSTYTDWKFTNIQSKQTNSNVQAHGDSYFGNTGGKETGSVVTNEKIESPQNIVFYISKESTNTTASSWLVKVSSDGTTWTQVGEKQSASAGITRGTWYEVKRDLSSYKNVYVGIFYDGTSAKRCIDDVTLTYGAAPTVATPTFSPAAGTYISAQNVTINTATEGATIYYTTDGSIPTTSSDVYSSAINVSETTTIKAMAVKADMDNSSVASATYTITTPYANIAALTAAATETATTQYVTLNNAVVTYVNGNYAYIQDATGAVVMFKNGHGLKAGDVLNGTASVSLQLRNANPQITSLEEVTPTSGTAPEPTTVAASAWNSTISAELSKYLKITGATITQNSNKYYVQLGEESVQLYGQGDANPVSVSDLKVTYTIIGFPTLYNTTPELQIFVQPEAESATRKAVTLTFDPSSVTATDTGALSDTPTLTITDEDDQEVTRLTIKYSSSDSDVATVDESTGAVTVNKYGTATITATFAGDDDYLPGSASYTLTVIDPNVPGSTAENPYTVAQARAAIDAGTGTTGVYATGIVSEIVTAYNSQYGNISYNISADGSTTSDQLQAYRGKSYNGANFTSADDIQVGDVVVIYGNLKKYNDTYEFDANNQLVSLTRPVTPTITVTPTAVEAAATETEGTLMVTYTEIDTPEVLFYAADGTNTATYDWIVAKLNSDNNVDYIISANTGEARTAYLKVHGLDADANNVYSGLITISQAAYVAPGTGYCYKKVTSTADITDGEYLIVYESESGNVAFNGGLEALDAVSNTISVTIDENKIDATEATNAATFTIDTTNGTLKSASGKYIGVSSNSNGLKQTAESDTYTHSFSIDADGNAVIAAVFEGSTMTLRYNKASNQTRFRYYKEGQEAIQLYKKVETEEVPVNQYGKGTYVTKKALDFTGITTVTAYVATAQNGSDVTFDPVTKVPAGTPLLVKGATTDVPVIASAEEIGTNFLVAGSGEGVASVAGGKYNFILNYKDGAVGFYRAAGNTVAKDRAYLSLSENISAAKLNVIFSDETTGINNVNAVENTNDKVFNLAGQQMKSAVKGVYIKNGKKFVK